MGMVEQKTKRGFTIIELVVVIFFAMYYALEEGFHAKNGYYPEKISEENLTVMDPSLFTDPGGVNLGREGSTYSYEAANCSNGKCKEYTLKAQMEKEDTYIKKNRS